MRYWIAAFLLALGVASCQARGGLAVTTGGGGGGGGFASCTFAGTASVDGCSGAVSGLSGKSTYYTRAAFFGTCPAGTTNNYTCTNGAEKFAGGYAQQFNQSYKQIPNWNVAGVDYPVGVPAGTVLQDPATLASYPSSCGWNATYNSIVCDPIHNGGTCNNPTFSNLDLSLHGGTSIELYANCTGTLTVTNSYWKRGVNEQGKVIFADFGSGNTADIVVKNSYFYDDNSVNPTSGNPNYTIHNLGTGAVYSSYNAFFGARQGSLYGQSTLVSQFDYVEGVNYSNDAHAETMYSSPPSGATVPLYEWSYSTYLGPASYGSGLTTLMWFQYPSCGIVGGSCAVTPTYTNFTIDHGVFIQNMATFTGSIAAGTPNVLTVSAMNAQPPGGGIFVPPAKFWQLGADYASVYDQMTTIVTGIGDVGTYNLAGTKGAVASQTWYYPRVAGLLTRLQANIYNYTSTNVTNNYVDPTGNSGDCFYENAPGNSATVTGNVVMLDASGFTYTSGSGATCNGTH